MKTSQSDAALFPKGFYDIGEKTFEWVFKNREEFVSFTIQEMLKPTGLYLEWKEYCVNKSIRNGRLAENSEATE